jgi:transcriptional regulator with PAS, ATPase and Fis domain
VLDESGGNRQQAARILGISLRTLQYRIKEYGL